MQGYLSLVLHAHLPFVRHPEHPRFLEESWLFEAITETYIPLLKVLEGWQRDGMQARLTLTLTPTLCAMLLDPLLQERYERHLKELIELAEKETHRTHWDAGLNSLAEMYLQRFNAAHESYLHYGRNLVRAFRELQDAGVLEIITCAATHALLPLLAGHPPSIRAQILIARDHYRMCFGKDPRGIWLPECAYVAGVEKVLQEANIRWFITDTHGVLHARPRPRYGVFAPIYTLNGIAAFGRDLESAKQVWSKDEGYPGDPVYRDFYRDIGFDLDLDYVKPYLPAPDQRGFTGIKYHRITGGTSQKSVYNRAVAVQRAADHAQHFLLARVAQMEKLASILDRPPLILSPYDAELFGHWWYEGPEFLDYFVRKAYFDQKVFTLISPDEYLKQFPSNQVAEPSASSWGEEGYWRVWLNETNEWIYPHLHIAQERMTQLVRRFPSPTPLEHRALTQAARELLLVQSSDWPFILRTGTSPNYARRRVKDHLLRFMVLHDHLLSGDVDPQWLEEIEAKDNLFDTINYYYWE
ncbi:MAG TPA: 1,4-alpha-glucan branching protein domain-containing protein [Verrucomicrobiae bacterium]|nr:1,4-alpha-glucan branching protein domain-containing protein [Verrucomicrobiae bacterium]